MLLSYSASAHIITKGKYKQTYSTVKNLQTSFLYLSCCLCRFTAFKKTKSCTMSSSFVSLILGRFRSAMIYLCKRIHEDTACAQQYHCESITVANWICSASISWGFDEYDFSKYPVLGLTNTSITSWETVLYSWLISSIPGRWPHNLISIVLMR